MGRGIIFSAPLSAMLWAFIFTACGLFDLAAVSVIFSVITMPFAVCLFLKEKRDGYNRLS